MYDLRVFKYIFILIVIGLISFAAYKIYEQDKDVENQENTESAVMEKKVISNMRLGISKYDTMNPLLSTNKAVQYIDKLIFEPLVTINEDFSVSSCLAKEYSRTGDLSYVIKLKNDIKWHDSMPLVAKDVQFTIDKLKDGTISSIYQENVRHVQMVEVIDEYTIKITLDEQVPFFEYNLIFPILPYHYYIDEDFASSTRIPIGTGMYKITAIDSSYISINKNENWWNKEKKLQIDNITVNIYTSMGEVYNAFKIGNIDLIPTSNANFNQYIGTIGFNVKEYSGRDCDFLVINTDQNIALQQKEVRQAIAHAIDKNNIVATIFNNTYNVSNHPLDYGNYLYDGEVPSRDYNPETAQQILEDNGWEMQYRTWTKYEDYRTMRTSFYLVVNSSNAKRVAVAESIKNQLSKVGIEVYLRKVSDSQYQYYLDNKNYDLIITGTTTSAMPNMNLYFGENNLANFYNEEVEDIMNDLYSINDRKILKEKFKRLQEIYQEEVPYISLYRNREFLISNTSFVGELNSNWFNIYYNIENCHRQN